MGLDAVSHCDRWPCPPCVLAARGCNGTLSASVCSFCTVWATGRALCLFFLRYLQLSVREGRRLSAADQGVRALAAEGEEAQTVEEGCEGEEPGAWCALRGLVVGLAPPSPWRVAGAFCLLYPWYHPSSPACCSEGVWLWSWVCVSIASGLLPSPVSG